MDVGQSRDASAPVLSLSPGGDGGHAPWDASGSTGGGPDAPAVLFGCNMPWKGEDRGRRQWNASVRHGGHGPPNAGVMLLRATDAARATVAALWAVPGTLPR